MSFKQNMNQYQYEENSMASYQQQHSLQRNLPMGDCKNPENVPYDSALAGCMMKQSSTAAPTYYNDHHLDTTYRYVNSQPHYEMYQQGPGQSVRHAVARYRNNQHYDATGRHFQGHPDVSYRVVNSSKNVEYERPEKQSHAQQLKPGLQHELNQYGVGGCGGGGAHNSPNRRFPAGRANQYAAPAGLRVTDQNEYSWRGQQNQNYEQNYNTYPEQRDQHSPNDYSFAQSPATGFDQNQCRPQYDQRNQCNRNQRRSNLLIPQQQCYYFSPDTGASDDSIRAQYCASNNLSTMVPTAGMKQSTNSNNNTAGGGGGGGSQQTQQRKQYNNYGSSDCENTTTASANVAENYWTAIEKQKARMPKRSQEPITYTPEYLQWYREQYNQKMTMAEYNRQMMMHRKCDWANYEIT